MLWPTGCALLHHSDVLYGTTKMIVHSPAGEIIEVSPMQCFMVTPTWDLFHIITLNSSTEYIIDIASYVVGATVTTVTETVTPFVHFHVANFICIPGFLAKNPLALCLTFLTSHFIAITTTQARASIHHVHIFWTPS